MNRFFQHNITAFNVQRARYRVSHTSCLIESYKFKQLIRQEFWDTLYNKQPELTCEELSASGG